MKKIISFDKNLDFKTMIGEISSISLDHTLSFEDGSTISGNFLISGKYKLTEATRLEEEFDFSLPVDIMLSETLEEDGRKLEIDDFHYEVENDDSLACHIELKVEGVEIIEEEITVEPVGDLQEIPVFVTEEVREGFSDIEVLPTVDDAIVVETEAADEARECDGDIKTSVGKQDIEPVEEEVITMDKSNSEAEVVQDANVGSLFSSFRDSDETFATYCVYIVRHDETLESIMDKYQVTKEQLESYNNLTSIEVGSKIIIPTNHE